jgi:hypothetical protein
MKFRYLLDPLFLVCVGLYVLNRFVLEALWPGTFFGSYVNDLICIPFCVPIMLWGLKLARLRPADEPPQWYEIIIPLILWAAAFEVWLPRLPHVGERFTSDPLDVAFYVAGTIIAAAVWGWAYRDRPTPHSPAHNASPD